MDKQKVLEKISNWREMGLAEIYDIEAQYLWDICSKISGGVVIEIGSSNGMGSTFVMYNALENRNNKLICVDRWGIYSDEALIRFKPYHDNFFRNIIDHYLHISVIYAQSIEASLLFKDNIADMVFIDGGHTQQDLNTDISCWRPKIKKNGILCGHDYHMPDVKIIVDRDVINFNIYGTIWSAINNQEVLM